MEDVEAHKAGTLSANDLESGKVKPEELVGQRLEGAVQSAYNLMLKQKWGFVISDSFIGKVFWHITENPDMQEVEFDRDDVVEFDLVIDEERGGLRAKHMKWMKPKERPFSRPQFVSEKKQRK